VEECTAGTGGVCGSLDLDRGFQNLVEGKLDKAVKKKRLTPKRAGELVRYLVGWFNSSIKRSFNPLELDCETVLQIPVPENLPMCGIGNGYLHLTKFQTIRENC